MWRHEDLWRTLGGGIDFITGEPLEDEWAQSRAGAEDDGMVRMAPAPLIHGAAMVATLACLFIGDTAVILPKFDPHAVWAAVQRHQVNVLSIIGDAMARPLMEALAAGDYDTSSLISLNSTAALFSPAVKDACAKALPNVVHQRGDRLDRDRLRRHRVRQRGRRAPGRPHGHGGPDVIVIDEAGGVCGPGQTGKLARGGHIPLGYYKDPVKTAEMFTEVNGGRYAVPGDWARVEEDGTITLLGRGNTCVNTGGEKVYPEEVEGALKSHPDVFDSLVIGVPDDRLGQRVAALIQLRPGAVADEAARAGACARPARRLQGAAHGLVRGCDRPHRVRQGRLPLGAPVRRGSSSRHPGSSRAGTLGNPEASKRKGIPCGRLFATCLASSIRSSASPRPSTSPPRSAGPAAWACSAASGSTTRPSWTRSWTGWTRIPTGVRTASTWSCPPGCPPKGAVSDLEAMIPQAHRDFVEQTLRDLGVPPLPDGAPGGEGVMGWLHSVARKHVEVALAHPARLIANALGPPPPDVIASAHERGMLVAALAGKAAARAQSGRRAAWTSWSPRGTRPAGIPARSAAWC